ncbi:MAG: hypothetical protein IKD70_06935 [Eggerthellaceae bacterium]|nr:hypothetical protein [Eggerthellaceae bacterium]
MGARRAIEELLDLDTYPYFDERLLTYISSRAGIENDVKKVKKYLRESSRAKGFEFSSANLSQWFPQVSKKEYYLSPKTIFKLCLALGLDLGESAGFVFSCLHQNWFNYRVPDELIFCYYLSMQEVFGEETFARAEAMAQKVKDRAAGGLALMAVPAVQEAAGMTRLIERDMGAIIDGNRSDGDASERAFEEYLIANLPLFTGIRKSAIALYHTFFDEGAIGIKPLKELYQRAEGYDLPDTAYLDMRDTRSISSVEKDSDRSRKRLLWGAEMRTDWLENNEDARDWDILHPSEIKIERHAVEKMDETGVPRGNIIALLFFHFCYANAERFASGRPRIELFERFYDTTNEHLDDCGMMPLHPRKALDSLFLKSIANSGRTDPIDYMNETLRQFYRSNI